MITGYSSPASPGQVQVAGFETVKIHTSHIEPLNTPGFSS